ncbi:DUF4434 domain-containing protein [Sinosporangium siamense]|nr:DUF4434 domain-containing protein [Sinosporangium siamense]
MVAALAIVLPSGDVSAPEAGETPNPGQSISSSSSEEFTDPCGTFDTKTRTPYAITGYWLVPSSDECTWRRQLEAMHKVGGDTVIRIGTGLQPRRIDLDGRVLDRDGVDVDPRYNSCRENGLTCFQAAEQDLRKANLNNRISWTYAYRTDEAFGKDLLRCPGMEKVITTDRAVFHRIVALADGSENTSCDFSSKARDYHLILVAARPDDSLTILLNVADRFGMKVFPALPVAPRSRPQTTNADPRHIGTLTMLTRRILHDYGARLADRESFGGVYQPFELQLREMTEDHPTLKVYAEQHKIVEEELKGKPILVSPYLDARKRVNFGATPEEVGVGFRALARTGVGIIAPQDSRGTGKVGLFWPDEREKDVDERLLPVVGRTTNGTAYHASTRDYYREMAEARAEMAGEGFNVQLWANIEAFEPTGTEACGNGGQRGRTDKERLDGAVAMAGRYVSKVISYMWTDFMTCGSPSLSDRLAADWDRPIAVDAVRKVRDIRNGIEVRGYNLAGSTVNVRWEGLEEPKKADVAAVGWHSAEPSPGLPTGTQVAWVPFDWKTVPKDVWVRITVSAPDGRESSAPLHVRAQG